MKKSNFMLFLLFLALLALAILYPFAPAHSSLKSALSFYFAKDSILIFIKVIFGLIFIGLLGRFCYYMLWRWENKWIASKQ